MSILRLRTEAQQISSYLNVLYRLTKNTQLRVVGATLIEIVELTLAILSANQLAHVSISLHTSEGGAEADYKC